MSDAIFVNGLSLHAYHGVMPHEGKVGQTFKLDLVLDIDLADASRTDKLKDTVSYDLVVKTVSEALIALGGNVGNVPDTFDKAVAKLCDGHSVWLKKRSSNYRTPPWGVQDQPPFLNAAIEVATVLSPEDLLGRIKNVEKEFGRDRARE